MSTLKRATHRPPVAIDLTAAEAIRPPATRAPEASAPEGPDPAAAVVVGTDRQAAALQAAVARMHAIVPPPAEVTSPAGELVADLPSGEVTAEPAPEGSTVDDVPVGVDLSSPIDLMAPEGDEVTLSDVYSAVVLLQATQERLIQAIQIIGQQQQWMTDRFGEALGQFEQVMNSGGPMKMLGAMLGGKR